MGDKDRNRIRERLGFEFLKLSMYKTLSGGGTRRQVDVPQMSICLCLSILTY